MPGQPAETGESGRRADAAAHTKSFWLLSKREKQPEHHAASMKLP
jgi:hypothetical protein